MGSSLASFFSVKVESSLSSKSGVRGSVTEVWIKRIQEIILRRLRNWKASKLNVVLGAHLL